MQFITYKFELQKIDESQKWLGPSFLWQAMVRCLAWMAQKLVFSKKKQPAMPLMLLEKQQQLMAGIVYILEILDNLAYMQLKWQLADDETVDICILTVVLA